MARPRTEAAKGKYYAWSDLYNGGESTERKNANGSTVRVIESRNIIERGTAVTKSDLGVSDDEWDALIHSGSVRSYPVPDTADDYLSPHRAIIAEIVDEDGEIDVDKVMQLGQLSLGGLVTLPEPINPPAEEGKTIGEPAGA